MVFQELCPAAGCQTYIHFCLVSQAISSPYVAVNAYRDTNPCLKLQICAAQEEETICLLVLCSKLASYFTPAGIYSHFPPSGQLLGFCVKMDFWHGALTVFGFVFFIYKCIYCFLISPAFKWMTHHVSLASKVSGGKKREAVFGI